MADIVDALVFKLQSKICYHRDANVEYLEIKTMVDKLVQENKKLQGEKMEFQNLINFVIQEKENLQHDYDQVIKEGVAPTMPQLETVKKELEETKHENVAAKRELEEAKHELVAAKKELEEEKHEHVTEKKAHVVAKRQLAQRIEELEFLRKKLQENEAMHTQLQQQEGNAPGPEPVHSRRVCTRSKHKRTQESDGHGEVADEHEFMDNPDHGLSTELENAKKELSDIHSKLIKGFMDIGSTGGRNVSIKNIGQLSDKPFQQACLNKLPPEEASKKASELYNFWQKQLLNPDWKLSKTSMDEGIPKKIEVHDVELQELRDEWGGEVYNAVVNCLVEIEECGRLMNTTIIPEIWNYKEDRKATRSESVEYIFREVKRLRGAKGRMTRGRRY